MELTIGERNNKRKINHTYVWLGFWTDNSDKSNAKQKHAHVNAALQSEGISLHGWVCEQLHYSDLPIRTLVEIKGATWTIQLPWKEVFHETREAAMRRINEILKKHDIIFYAYGNVDEHVAMNPIDENP